ncbi:hypothetical protein F1B92_01300 [Campylobacter sp. FMV-PI01]|uniref:Uncharacterized protein n=1 Tax=Campylobacter portucalensis TaxID=2608384 RepID=A0A6L5WHE2_9BACT|nr:hypothetical protein [Campylobacter portucalensis]MSN95842.1 hypothetical protein [Campylobacter portucalensis]
MKYYGKSKRAVNDEDRNQYIDEMNSIYKGSILIVRDFKEVNSQPLVWDFYVIYEPIKNLSIK